VIDEENTLAFLKIGTIGSSYRHMQRYRQILAVFFKYGFGDLINALKIEQYLEVGLPKTWQVPELNSFTC